ncbi:hypothetical protein FB567DRAFT_614322 [Paraphoma chrysanthemicola]|uniref:Uncharacterized protein n=1 Tax=Paraphoma chrysanthemicola TaxID=798071 RepID=A0A8K0RDJ4_9PLEO|nr:hypothetical protein FB567DRAFT_614322 [Paraphoma chrysanthemicola]
MSDSLRSQYIADAPEFNPSQSTGMSQEENTGPHDGSNGALPSSQSSEYDPATSQVLSQITKESVADDTFQFPGSPGYPDLSDQDPGVFQSGFYSALETFDQVPPFDRAMSSDQPPRTPDGYHGMGYYPGHPTPDNEFAASFPSPVPRFTQPPQSFYHPDAFHQDAALGNRSDGQSGIGRMPFSIPVPAPSGGFERLAPIPQPRLLVPFQPPAGGAGQNQVQNASQQTNLTFNSFAQARTFWSGVAVAHDWVPLVVDPTIPSNMDEQRVYVRRMLDAFLNVADTYDAKNWNSPFTKRWAPRGNVRNDFYSVNAIETICWEILDVAERLHISGPATLHIYDPESLEKVKQTRKYSFDQRITIICYALRQSKVCCDGLMKGEGEKVLVGCPQWKRKLQGVTDRRKRKPQDAEKNAEIGQEVPEQPIASRAEQHLAPAMASNVRDPRSSSGFAQKPNMTLPVRQSVDTQMRTPPPMDPRNIVNSDQYFQQRGLLLRAGHDYTPWLHGTSSNAPYAPSTQVRSMSDTLPLHKKRCVTKDPQDGVDDGLEDM